MRYKRVNYRLYPTEDQKSLISKTFGCCRFVYNRALEIKMAAYQTDKTCLSVFEIMGRMVQWRKDEETQWLKEVSAQALQASLSRLDRAYTTFFRKQNAFPHFKSRSDKQSFTNPQSVRVDWDLQRLYIPKFKKGIKLAVDRIPNGEVKSATVTRHPSGRYYVSIVIEEPTNNPVAPKPTEARTLGLDLGIKTFLTDSTGGEVPNPRHFAKQLKRLKKAQRKLSRRVKGSVNREKQRAKVARIHESISNSRRDFLHKITTGLIKNQDYDSFAIEDLNVEEMRVKKQGSSKSLRRAIGDVGWGTFRQLLTYKCGWYGKNLLTIGRFEPSSRLCTCGYHNHALTLRDREWTCPKCHTTHQRDVLAAQNIKRFAFCRQDTTNNLVRRESPEITPVELPVRVTSKQELVAPQGHVDSYTRT